MQAIGLAWLASHWRHGARGLYRSPPAVAPQAALSQPAKQAADAAMPAAVLREHQRHPALMAASITIPGCKA